MSDSIERLFDEAIATIRVARRAKVADLAETTTRALFLDPKHWERRRGIALIHADSETLLGNFSEYIHRSVAGARKLVREESPIAVSATERVSGSWWLGENRQVEPRREWHEVRTCIVHLHLDELQVRSPAVEVSVALEYGGIARVELVTETKFAGEGCLIFLPAGTDILAACSLDTKLSVRTGVGL